MSVTPAQRAIGKGTAGPVVDVSDVLFDGTFTATVSAAPLNGGTHLPCSEVLVQNDPANAVNIKVGNETSQSVVLIPGQTYAIAIDDVAKVYVKAASATPTVNWSARS